MTDHITDFQVAHFDALVEESRRQLRVSCDIHETKHEGHSLIHCPDALYDHWKAKTARLLRAQIIHTSSYRRRTAA